uniref:CDK5 regulatory subunit associated protein 1-like 1 n=1 Tax=Mus spicilegus TaxID=10103 RepID=A0A8C6MQ27_MUSSI
MPSAACDVLLDDIEDIISQEDSKPQDRQFSRKHVFPKVRRRNTQKYLQEELRPPSDSTIPGIQKIWIRTWGCSHNNSDGEYMAGQLAAYGYKITAQSGKESSLGTMELIHHPVRTVLHSVRFRVLKTPLILLVVWW